MKAALVTGGTSGIGLELVKLFLNDGYKVVVAARSSAMPNDELFESVVYIQSDLSKPGAANKLYTIVKQKEISIDVLVNNAGFGNFGEFTSSKLSNQVDMMRLNMQAITELTHLFLPEITITEGKIMFIGSTASFPPGPFMSVYFATKHYVLAFGEALAAELKPKGVSVTVLCPGPTNTGFKKSARIKSRGLFKGTLPTAESVANYGYRSLQTGKVVAIHGFRNKISSYIIRVLPKSLVRSLAYKYNQPQ